MDNNLKKMQMRVGITSFIGLLICSSLILTRDLFDAPTWLWLTGLIIALLCVVYSAVLAFRMIINLRRRE